MIKLTAYEEAAREWMKGCSCAPKGRPWECVACTEAFHAHLRMLMDTPPNTLYTKPARTHY